MNLLSKLPAAGTTIFSTMTELASKHKAINLAQGFPNFPPEPELIETCAAAMRRGLNQYAPMAGYVPLRERIAEKTHAIYGYAPSPETEITVTPGATAALFAAIMATVRRGDEVIVFEPCYDSYLPALALAEAVVRTVKLRFPDFSLPWKEVGELISPKTRMIIINTPHNPTGALLRDDDMQKLTALVQNTDIIVLSDEVYEHIVFDGERHASVLRYPALRERSFAVSSFGKTYHVTGWKTGYCIAPPDLSAEFRKVYQYVNFSSFTPAQAAFAEILANKSLYERLPQFYETKRNLFRRLMGDSRFEFLPCHGSYFQLAGYQAISELSDKEFAQWLTVKYGVACIPLSPFFADASDFHIVRFCFAKTEETLKRAAEILERV
jgi:methionine aminotransferase